MIGKAVFHVRRHEEARHQREVEGHVALVAVTEIGRGVLGPLVGLGEEHAVGIVGVDVPAEGLQEGVGLGQVLAVRALALVQIGDGIESETVDAHLEPEVDALEERFTHRRVVEVEIGLVRVETVPVVRLCDRVPGPVGNLEILEDDASFGVALRRVAPDVEVARSAAGRGAASALEPRVLVGGVVDDQLDDDTQAAGVGLAQEDLDVVQRAVGRMDVGVVGDVVSVVA